MLATLAVAAVPFLTQDGYLLKILAFVGLNVIVVVGLSLLFGYAGQISLGHAAFFGIGAYASGYVTATLHRPWFVGLSCALLISAGGGLVLALPSLRLKGHYLAMATLGFSEIMSVAFVEARGVTGGVNGLSGIPPAAVGNLSVSSATGNYVLVWATAVAVVFLAANVVRSRPGLAMRAIHGSELGAQACGVDVVRVKTQAFTLSAVLAGLGGALYAQLVGFVSPSSFTLELSILLVAMVVLGGTCSLVGPIAAAVVLSLLPYLDALVPGLPRSAVAVLQDWETDIYGLTIILVMLFLPGGMAGAARRLMAAVGRSRVGDARGEEAA
ncbi:MAG: branched-chain amino acid ABC transporter permease [Coriobacteriia bacterium]